MSGTKKILIISASAGAGHNQAAKAVQQALQNTATANVSVIDFMDSQHSYLNNLLKESYLRMIDVFPDMYDFLYRWTQVPTSGSKVHYLLAQAMKRDMLALINKHRPDLLIFTHPFPCVAASYLRRIRQIDIPLAGIITDFAVHRLWIHKEINLYFVASPDIKKKLIQEGICPAKIHATGIPIDAGFAQPLAQQTVRLELGLHHHRPVILLMGGGLGLGPVKQSLASLNSIRESLQIIVVAGNNEKLRDSLENATSCSRHSIQVFGYTNHIRKLMAASDLLITKAGALTSSEALAMELPMIFYQPLPGQEEENAVYLTAKNVAKWVKNSSELKYRIYSLVNQPALLQEMKTNARQLQQPLAANTIAQLIQPYINDSLTQAVGLNNHVGGENGFSDFRELVNDGRRQIGTFVHQSNPKHY